MLRKLKGHFCRVLLSRDGVAVVLEGRLVEASKHLVLLTDVVQVRIGSDRVYEPRGFFLLNTRSQDFLGLEVTLS